MHKLATLPVVSRFEKFDSRSRVLKEGSFAGKVNQFGINMVDLMMWLVIAALLLAAALQGIGFYQRAAWTYQLNSDAASLHTFMEAQYTLNGNVYPTLAQVQGSTDLKLTADTAGTNKVTATTYPAGGWTATICSPALTKASATANNAVTVYSNQTPNLLSIAATC